MALKAYMQVEGIEGECSDQDHKNWIQIDELRNEMEQSCQIERGGSQGLTCAGVKMGQFIVGKRIDKSSPELARFCCTGTHIGSVVIDQVRTVNQKQHVYMKYTLSDAVVAAVKVEGSSAAPGPAGEQIGLSFCKVQWEYTPLDERGNPGPAVVGSWDLTTNA